MLQLIITKRTDPLLLKRMSLHYSKPKGFVGRNICYKILYENKYYGYIVGGSATKFLPNRNDYFGIDADDLNKIVNNIFYSISRVNNKYPKRNFTSYVLREFTETVSTDWEVKYGDHVLGFETLIELPRTGELYRRAGWKQIGVTKGYTCKRVSGKGSDSWSGKRVWNTNKDSLRPKLVFAYCLN